MKMYIHTTWTHNSSQKSKLVNPLRIGYLKPDLIYLLNIRALEMLHPTLEKEGILPTLIYEKKSPKAILLLNSSVNQVSNVSFTNSEVLWCYQLNHNLVTFHANDFLERDVTS